MHVEVWHFAEPLPDQLSCNLRLEVGRPNSAELTRSIGTEAVVTSLSSVLVVGGPPGHHRSIIGVLSEKGLLEFPLRDSPVST